MMILYHHHHRHQQWYRYSHLQVLFYSTLFLQALLQHTSTNASVSSSVTKSRTTVVAAFSTTSTSTLTSSFSSSRNNNKDIHTMNAINNNGNNSNNKIFCFGDSLTAGTSPPSFQEYPYAKHLESTLNKLHVQAEADAEQQQQQGQQQGQQQQQQQHENSYMVRHNGFPGWTAKQLSSSEGNLKPTLERIKQAINTYPSLVIILAGTNDLAYCTTEQECHAIYQQIRSIHEICHEKHIDTIALSIPSSAWQAQSNNNAALFAKSINEQIETWAKGTIIKQPMEQPIPLPVITATEEKNQHPIVHYIPFPIDTYDQQSGYWSTDGLHFSPEGYEFIGKTLAPIVKNILDLKSK